MQLTNSNVHYKNEFLSYKRINDSPIVYTFKRNKSVKEEMSNVRSFSRTVVIKKPVFHVTTKLVCLLYILYFSRHK